MTRMDFSQVADLEPKGEYDAAMIDTRVLAALSQDPLTSMLTPEARQGLALGIALRCAPKPQEAWVYGTDWDAFHVATTEVLDESPLGGVLSNAAVFHIAKIVRRAVFPATFREKTTPVCGAIYRPGPGQRPMRCTIRGQHDQHSWAGAVR